MIGRYTRPEMGGVWSDERRMRGWLEVELAATDAWAAEGRLPAEAAAACRERAAFTVEAVRERERETNHDVAAFVDVVAASIARDRLGAIVLVVFGFVSLILATVGTYGLMSFSVNQRFNEIAVRSAFGAERGKLLKMFVTRAAQLAGIGIVLGVAGAVAMRQVLASQLYETSALDPWVLALVPLSMLAVTLLASYVPARRASRIDVTAALREN